MLVGSEIISLWREQDRAGKEHCKLAAALRANMHHARPAPDALALGWRKAGMKAVAWRVMRCRPVQVKQLVDTLLEGEGKRMARLALILAQRTDCAANIFSRTVTIHPLATLRAALLYFHKFGDASDLNIWDIVKPSMSTANFNGRKGLRHILGKREWVPKSIQPDYCAILYLTLIKSSDSYANSFLRNVLNNLANVSDDQLANVMLQILKNIDNEHSVSFPAIVIRYLMLSKCKEELNTRIEKIGNVFLVKMEAFVNKKDASRFLQRNLAQLLTSLHYNVAFFDTKYQCCLEVIEWFLTWMRKFMPEETYFEYYVRINATMMYYKAVRQSMEEYPEVFEDPVKRMTEGVDIVGFTFGKYIAKEVAQQKSNYFESIIEIYSDSFVNFLKCNFLYGSYKKELMSAIIKGIISESKSNEARLGIQICQSVHTKDTVEIKDLLYKSEDKETQYFLHAEYLN